MADNKRVGISISASANEAISPLEKLKNEIIQTGMQIKSVQEIASQGALTKYVVTATDGTTTLTKTINSLGQTLRETSKTAFEIQKPLKQIDTSSITTTSSTIRGSLEDVAEELGFAKSDVKEIQSVMSQTGTKTLRNYFEWNTDSKCGIR